MSAPEARPDRVRIELTEWTDRWHWTVWSDPQDFQSEQVEGVLVPWATAEEDKVVAFTRTHALRRALIACERFTPRDGMEVVVPLADAISAALMTEHDRFPEASL